MPLATFVRHLLSVVVFPGLLVMPVLAQVQVTFRVAPSVVYPSIHLAGSFNGWNASDPAYRLADPDGDGVFEVTVPLAVGQYVYKFAVPGAAWLTDADNPHVTPDQWENSIVDVADPMVMYLLPRDGQREVRYGSPVRAVLAHSAAAPLDISTLKLKIDGVPVPNPVAHYDAQRKTLTYHPPTPLEPGSHVVEVQVRSTAGIATRRSTFNVGSRVRLMTENVVYRKADIVVYGEASAAGASEVFVEFNGTRAAIAVVEGRFKMPVRLVPGDNVVRVFGSAGAPVPESEQVHRFAPLRDPRFELTGAVSGRSVTLTAAPAAPTTNTLVYRWHEAASNPAPLGVEGRVGATISFTAPASPGEYYVSATATDEEGRTFTARRYVDVDGDMVHLNRLGGHAAWVDRMVLYEVNLHIFSDSRDLAGLTQRLDELADLGVTALYLMPIGSSTSVDGYQPEDYFTLRSSYGTDADLHALVQAAHARGMRVILDLVFNHSSIAHPFFQNVRALKQDSPFAQYYVWGGVPGASDYHYTLSPAMPALNLEDPETREYFIQAAEYWVRTFDIDGYKADVGWAVQQRSPTFWRAFRQRMKAIKPDFFMLVEAFPPLDPYFEERFDSAYDHDLRGYGYEDANVLTRLLEGTATVDELDAVIQHAHPPPALPYRFAETHDLPRLVSLFSPEASKLAHALVFTVGGIPNIWAGAEYGEDAPVYNMSDVIDRTDVDSLRPYLKALVDLRRRYIPNTATVTRLPSTGAVYSYVTRSDSHLVVTALNFDAVTRTAWMDWTTIAQAGGDVTLLDLVAGSTRTVAAADVAAHPVVLGPYEAAIFHVTARSSTDANARDAVALPELASAAPNPTSGAVVLRFSLPVAAPVHLAVYDVLGREVAVLAKGLHSAGTHRVRLEEGTLPSGLYFYRLQTGTFSAVEPLTLVR